jgi:enoyl-CoA hydratase/carnithine racemase
MAQRMEKLGSLVSSSARDFVGKRVRATQQYAETLVEFGDGRIEAQEFATKVAGLAAKEAIAVTGDMVDAMTEYWKGFAELFEPEAPDTEDRPARTAKKTATKKTKATRKTA